MTIVLLVVNLVISVFNAWAVGKGWVESRAAGGWARFMAWMGAVMSAIGFSWCYLVVIAFAAGPDGFNKLPAQYVQAMLGLGYLALVIPLIGSGLAITLDSWAYFWRRRSLTSGVVAGYNTVADVYNVYQATEAVPSAWKTVGDVLFGGKKGKSGSSSSDGALTKLVILLAVLAVAAGALTAAAIIRTVAERTAFDRRLQLGG